MLLSPALNGKKFKKINKFVYNLLDEINYFLLNSMGNFNTKMSLEQLEEKINNCVDQQQQLGAIFINFQLQKQLIKEQNEYNGKQLFWSRLLAVATICLVIATLLLIK